MSESQHIADDYFKQFKERFPDNKIEEAKKKIIKGVAADPLFQRWILKLKAAFERPVYVQSATDALGERLEAALIALSPEAKLEGSGSQDEEIRRLVISGTILRSEVFLIRQAILDDVLSLEVPTHIISPDVMPHDVVFFSFEEGQQLGNKEGKVYSIDWLCAIKVEHEEHVPDGGIALVVCLEEAEESKWYSKSIIIRQLPPILFGKSSSELEGISLDLLRVFAFINSPYTETVEQAIDRPAYREMVRSAKGKEVERPFVRVVQLRARINQQSDEHLSGAKKGKDGHWWVRGHLRAQWYAKEATHKLIWIQPFVKGDTSKPLLQKVYDVAR